MYWSMYLQFYFRYDVMFLTQRSKNDLGVNNFTEYHAIIPYNIHNDTVNTVHRLLLCTKFNVPIAVLQCIWVAWVHMKYVKRTPHDQAAYGRVHFILTCPFHSGTYQALTHARQMPLETTYSCCQFHTWWHQCPGFVSLQIASFVRTMPTYLHIRAIFLFSVKIVSLRIDIFQEQSYLFFVKKNRKNKDIIYSNESWITETKQVPATFSYHKKYFCLSEW